ncbi:OmpA family protein [Desulfovibrio sp. OttesenSCG-928-C06]|nr:OmpA family protein [Desulfovibrio sp. OttesenSCG-928-C06]
MIRESRRRRSKRQPAPLKKGIWMVTFSDLSTLVLALFVLLFSMSSIDSGLVERISSSLRDESLQELPGIGRADSHLNEVLELLLNTQKLVENENRLKELLFPDDVLPPEQDKGMILENIRITTRDNGVGIVFSEDLLFAEGSAAIGPDGRRILGAVTPLLRAVPYDIMITGHSDDNVYAGEKDDTVRLGKYQLSGARALAVMGVYMRAGLEKRRFSAAGYGPDQPLEPAYSGADSVTGRRVEIVVKSTGASANYY